MTGLAVVPILPYLFDHPVKRATDRALDWIRQKLLERSEAVKKGIDRKEL